MHFRLAIGLLLVSTFLSLVVLPLLTLYCLMRRSSCRLL